MVVLAAGLVLGACGGGDSLAADAGDDFTVSVGESPTFDGCESSGDILNYAWKIIEAPPSMAEEEGKMIVEANDECSFTLDAAMIADEAGRWMIELTITDEDGATSVDTVAVEVTG